MLPSFTKSYQSVRKYKGGLNWSGQTYMKKHTVKCWALVRFPACPWPVTSLYITHNFVLQLFALCKTTDNTIKYNSNRLFVSSRWEQWFTMVIKTGTRYVALSINSLKYQKCSSSTKNNKIKKTRFFGLGELSKTIKKMLLEILLEIPVIKEGVITKHPWVSQQRK